MTTDPHLAMTHGPSGQLIADYKAFSRDYPDLADFKFEDCVDKRDNRDPEEVWAAVLLERNGGKAVFDNDPARNLSPITLVELDFVQVKKKIDLKHCENLTPHVSHFWQEDKPGGRTFWCARNEPRF